MAARRRYVIDTNLYIDALRSETGRAALTAFHESFTPFLHLSAVVVQELRAGVPARATAKFETAMFGPYERRGRLITPSYAAWKEAGRVLAELVTPANWRTVSRSFVNDVLLAISCREAGAVLVTANTADFSRIAAACSFEFVPPWPWPYAARRPLADRGVRNGIIYAFLFGEQTWVATRVAWAM